MDRKSFAALKSKCKTSRQMRAFNELVASFAKSPSENSDLKEYQKFASDLYDQLVTKHKFDKGDLSVTAGYDKSEDEFYIVAKLHGGNMVNLPEKYYDKVFNYTKDDIEDAAIDIANKL